MAQNETINNLVDPKVYDELDKLLDKLLINSSEVEKFNVALGNSKGFNAINTNSKKVNDALKQLVDTQNRVAQTQERLTQNRLDTTLDRQAAAATKLAAKVSAANDPFNQLTASLKLAEQNALSMGATFGATSPQFLEASNSVKILRDQVDSLEQPLGRFQRNVGNYSSAFTGYANTLRGLRGPTKLLGEALGLGAQEADQFRLILEHSFQGIAAFFRGKEAKAAASAEAAVATTAETAAETAQTAAQNTNTISTEANTVATEGAAVAETELAGATTGASTAMTVFRGVLVGLGIGVVLGLIGYLVFAYKDYRKSVDEANASQKYFKDALESTDYKNAVSNVTELTENIKLAKEGFLKKDEVLKQYNDTVGKTIGVSKTLTGAEANLVQKGPAFIAMTLAKAAAQSALKDATEATYKIAQIETQSDEQAAGYLTSGVVNNIKNLQAEADKAKKSGNTKAYNNLKAEIVAEQDLVKKGAQANKADQEKDLKKQHDTAIAWFKKLQEDAAKIAKDPKNKVDFFGGTEDPDKGKKPKRVTDTTRKDLTAGFNEAIDAEKKKNEQVQQNDQSSYDQRLQSTDEFQKKSIELINDRTVAELKNSKLTQQQKLNIAAKGENDVTGVELEAQKERQTIHKKVTDDFAKAFKGNIDSEKEFQDEIINITKEAGQKQIQQIENNKNSKLLKLEEQYASQKIGLIKFNKEKADIEAEANQKTLAAEIANQQTILADQNNPAFFEIADAKEIQKTEQNIADLKIKLSKSVVDQQISDLKRRHDAELKTADLIGKGEQELQGFIVSILSARFTKEENEIKKQQTILDANTKNQIDAENRSLDSAQVKADKITVINAQAAAQKQELTNKENQIKNKQAKIDKAAAIATATEQGILATLHGLFEGGILEAFAYGAFAALQIGKLIATPVPQYFTGTPSSKAGPAWVGERGTELAIEPSGKKWLTPEVPTLMNLTGGTKIINNKELMQSMARPPQFQNMAPGIDIEGLILEQRANNRELRAVKEAILAGQRQPPRRGLNYNDSRFNTYYQGLKQ